MRFFHMLLWNIVTKLFSSRRIQLYINCISSFAAVNRDNFEFLNRII